MRRPRVLMIGTVVVGLVLAACASPAGSEPGASSGSEPSAAAEASQAGGDGGGGGGGGGIGTTLPDGAWSSGDLHVTISGDANGSYDAPLYGAGSYTNGGETILSYIDADGSVSVGVAINADSFSISVTTAELVAGGGTTTNCTVEYHTADDNNIDADFSCPNSPAFTMTGTSGGTVNIEGSLTARR